MAGPRSRARCYALLALYQWQLGRQSAADIAQHFYDDPLWMDAVARGLAGCGEDQPIPTDQRFDLSLFDQLLRGVTLQVDEIDATLKPFLDRSLTSVDPVERAILRLGTFELLHSPHIPSAVILDEAVDLAKAFGAEQGHRFINGVLDKLAQQRPDLVSRHGSLEHDG